MSIKCFRYVFITLCMLSHTVITFGQIRCPEVPRTRVTPRGDSTQAHLAQHHSIYDGRAHIVHLGYIDTTIATVKEILDNLPLGLRVLPVDSTKIVSYYISYIPKGLDAIGPYEIIGSKMPRSFLGGIIDDRNRTDTIYYEKKRQIRCLYKIFGLDLKVGDRIVFFPIIQRGNEKPFELKNFSITVR